MNSDKPKAYEDTGLTPDEIERMKTELSAYRDAEKDGRLVVLPCKAGDTVYVIDETTPPKVARAKVNKIRYQQIYGRGFVRTLAFADVIFLDGTGYGPALEFDGKTGENAGIYHTRAEAETAIMERMGGN